MATYVNDLRLKEIATGDEAGTWGTSTNTNLELIGEALGYGTQDCFASDADATTTVADGASDPARAMYFKITSSATLTATRTLTISPNTISRVMLIENATTGSQSITISQGSGSTVTIASGAVKMVYLDGAGAGGAVVEALADLELPTITVADLTATTADINAGTIDGTVIGGSSAAAGTFTSITGTQFSSDATDVELKYSGSTKLATTATGIDVTGTVTADGLTISSAENISFTQTHTDGNVVTFTQSGTGGDIDWRNANGSALIRTADASRLLVSDNGDISFYEDTGTTPKFFWDASAESLGIGTTSPAKNLHIKGDSNSDGITIQRNSVTANDYAQLGFLASTTDAGTPSAWLRGSRGASSGLEYLTLGTSNIERMRIDSSGNVGIGTTSPDRPLHVQEGSSGIASRAGTVALIEGSANTKITVASGATSTGEVIFGRNGDNDAGSVRYDHSTNSMQFDTNSVERMRIDASGNLLVGTTTANSDNAGHGLLAGNVAYHTRAGSTLILNRLSTNGEIAIFRKDGATVGSIGADSGDLTIGTADTGIRFLDSSDAIAPYNVSTAAVRDNAIDLGYSAGRFDDIYATNATIQTSDRNEKQDIEALSEAEHRVAVAAKGLLRKFRWKDSVAEKGDEARIHFGIIAQDLQAAFEAEGLDAGRYAMFINSTWTDEETGEERSRMGVRYSELLAFIIAAI